MARNFPAVGLLCLFTFSAAGAYAQQIPADLKAMMVKEAALSSDEIAKIESGGAIAKLLPSKDPAEVQLLGMVRIDVSATQLLNAYRDIANFETGKGVRQTRKFSDPPSAEDMQGLQVPDLNAKDVEACRPGSCAYKFPVDIMEALKTKVNWDSPTASSDADAMLRQIAVERLKHYKKEGNRALPVYHDAEQPYPIANGLQQLIEETPVVGDRAPQLVRFLETYPEGRPPDTEDFLYWQEAEFGLKPVVRVTHVVIEKLPETGSEPRYLIASKMLFCSHYFRAAVEFKSLYGTRTASGKPVTFFTTYQSSYVDGLTGFKGRILKKISEGRSQSKLEESLEVAKARLEKKP